MILNRRCKNCGKEYKFDPLDGLPQYCEECYYELGLGDEPGEEYQGQPRDQGATVNRDITAGVTDVNKESD